MNKQQIYLIREVIAESVVIHNGVVAELRRHCGVYERLHNTRE